MRSLCSVRAYAMRHSAQCACAVRDPWRAPAIKHIHEHYGNLTRGYFPPRRWYRAMLRDTGWWMRYGPRITEWCRCKVEAPQGGLEMQILATNGQIQSTSTGQWLLQVMVGQCGSVMAGYYPHNRDWYAQEQGIVMTDLIHKKKDLTAKISMFSQRIGKMFDFISFVGFQ